MEGYSHIPRPADVDVVGKRIGAVLIDGFVITLLYFVLAPALLSSGTSPMMALFILPLAVVAAYSLLLEGFWNGYTVGKRAMGIKVVREDGSPISLGDSLIRNLLRAVDGVGYYLVGLLFISTSDRNQRLGDQIAGTVVVAETTQPQSWESRAAQRTQHGQRAHPGQQPPGGYQSQGVSGSNGFQPRATGKQAPPAGQDRSSHHTTVKHQNKTVDRNEIGDQNETGCPNETGIHDARHRGNPGRYAGSRGSTETIE